MLKTFTTSPLVYEFDDSSSDHIISVQNNAQYDFSHLIPTHDGLIELSVPYYSDYALQQIPDKIFKNCADLSAVYGKEVRTIGNSTFEACDSLKSVNFPALKKIGSNAFAHCNLSIISLTSVGSVTNIETDSFYNNFRRPVSVYIPGSLSTTWYDRDQNGNWKYIISSALSSISAECINKNYAIIVLSDNNLQFNADVRNILLSTSNQGNICKGIWDQTYPDMYSNFINLVNTLSIFAYANESELSTKRLKPEVKLKIIASLTTKNTDSKLSTVVRNNCKITGKDSYSELSGIKEYAYHLRKIQQFPVYDLSAINQFERYRPLLLNDNIQSQKVDISSVIDNIYRKTQNTVKELDNIFAPISSYCKLLLDAPEISSTQTATTDINTVKNVISCLSEYQLMLRDCVK